ncbi:MAG: UvsW helicase [Planctomycetaceae bacterium]|nr:UvsW helicase [Planctomycetaceae bacterium]
MSDDVVRWHLSGADDSGRDFGLGLYPLLRDETCFLLVIDLNQPTWQQDGQTILETCRQMSVGAAFEKSRSGNGGHIWLFFEQAIPATLARKLGALVLTESMERRPEIGLDAYSRCIPNQDTLPQKSFGSWVALPLQKHSREVGNCVFLDEHNRPHADQWTFLFTIQKISRTQIEGLVSAAQKRGNVVGVRTVPPSDAEHSIVKGNAAWQTAFQTVPLINECLPKRVELVLCSQIVIAKAGLPPGLRNRLVRLAAFQNPEFQQAQSMRLPAYDKPCVIGCAEDQAESIRLPRGCLADVQELFKRLKTETTVRDERQLGQSLAVEFQGVLRNDQETAARAMLAHDTGILSATTAFGKTVLAAWLIAQRGVNVLILVHRRQLLEQWVDRLASFLGLPHQSIGRVGGGRKKPNGAIDVALIQSLVHQGEVNEIVEGYGHLIIDECHHVSAHSFEQVIRRAKAKFVLGLSATVARKDGQHPIIFMQCGPVRHHVDALAQAAVRPFEHTVCVRPTGFLASEKPSETVRVQFQDLYSQLICDAARNQLICNEVLQSVRDGRSPLVLTERNEHLDRLAARLSANVQHLIVLRGGMSRTELKHATSRLMEIPPNENRVVLATGKFVGEGFDDPRLDTLFLTLPVSWQGTIAQYVGRLHRLHHGKREVRVYDYADLNVPMLSRMFDRRCRGYEAIGYQIQLPGSAVPGWPATIPLPVDPQWKDSYASAVRRLCKDGVDTLLANLFVDVTQATSPDAEGADRARSASEAFLFRRLETLPESAGRFRLNTLLPIPFDERGQMEVDLVCADARLVIELDGSQHLESPEAYRRDRRKDLLLQEQGYFVLRFLSQDVGVHLDLVLDTIFRALTHRQRTQEQDVGRSIEDSAG